jgi:CRP-like cAMP-binding protein
VTNRPNLVLSSLSEAARRALDRDFEQVVLGDAEPICEPHARIKRIYFPESAVISIVQVMREGTAAEIGMVGCEGFFGLEAILRDGTATGRAVCQVPGNAWVIPATTLRDAAQNDHSLIQALLHYAGGYCAMLAQLIACNRLHRVEQRCARWLLMTHDRIGEPVFPMTQERLSVMLGAQRPTVTAVMTTLRDAGCIESSRGQVRITDRKCLETYACECYALCASYFKL